MIYFINSEKTKPMKAMIPFPLAALGLLLFAHCSPDNQEGDKPASTDKLAVVLSVSATGSDRNYTFEVELKSPDTGCDQYANWWEVLTEDGQLLYRRILAHSHVNEQPFKRSGGSANALADQVLIIRGHMHPGGYGSGKIAMKGSVKTGFKVYDMPEGFAADMEKQSPQPTGCAF